jgi:hypothetical protein
LARLWVISGLTGRKRTRCIDELRIINRPDASTLLAFALAIVPISFRYRLEMCTPYFAESSLFAKKSRFAPSLSSTSKSHQGAFSSDTTAHFYFGMIFVLADCYVDILFDVSIRLEGLHAQIDAVDELSASRMREDFRHGLRWHNLIGKEHGE